MSQRGRGGEVSPGKAKQLHDAYSRFFPAGQFRGFECEDGWFDLLQKFFADIAAHLRIEGRSDVVAYRVQRVVFHQIKEKFGGLRLYFSGGDDYVHAAAQATKQRASETCERCGEPGAHKIWHGIEKTICASCEPGWQDELTRLLG